jgi:hypothetical protein
MTERSGMSDSSRGPLRSLIERLRRSARRLREKAEPDSSAGPICVVAILKDEGRFLEEWLAYHRLIGVDHFSCTTTRPSSRSGRWRPSTANT